MKSIKLIFAIAALLFVLAACASETPRTAEPLPTAVPADTPTPRPAPTATATPAPTPTPPAPTPTRVPPTATPLPPPTPTPEPVPDPLPERDSRELPHVFVGSVTIGGAAAPDGTEVTVWLEQYDAPIGTGSASGGNYTVLANQHGSRSFGGMTLIFKINGEDSGETAVWEKGAATILAISLN
ncbi:MAG: hypothetical protein IH872_09270 [Chloroflexi bacterium]|nr:hypothetical protein [Chloroflexota bacterium]